MKHQLQTIRAALTAAANLIAHQYSGTSLGMTALQDASDDCLEALTALSELERMAGEQEPCGWYDDDRVYWHEGKQPANGADLYTNAPPAQQPQYEAGDMASAHNDGFRAGVASVAQQPQAEPDMRKVCEALGFDPTNHHNAAKCPYCRGQQPQAKPLFAEAIDKHPGLKEELKAMDDPAHPMFVERPEPQAEPGGKVIWYGEEDGAYQIVPPQQPQAEAVPAAMKVVLEAMRSDPEYAWSWHCNVATAFVDAGGDHYTANQGAARFMRLLAGVEPAHELPEAPQQAEAVPSDVVRDAMVEAACDAVAAALGDAYDCTRVWEAWKYGTMGQDDFYLVSEDSDRVREIAVAAIDAATAQGERP